LHFLPLLLVRSKNVYKFAFENSIYYFILYLQFSKFDPVRTNEDDRLEKPS
jgi:hypothetical protein